MRVNGYPVASEREHLHYRRIESFLAAWVVVFRLFRGLDRLIRELAPRKNTV